MTTRRIVRSPIHRWECADCEASDTVRGPSRLAEIDAARHAEDEQHDTVVLRLVVAFDRAARTSAEGGPR